MLALRERLLTQMKLDTLKELVTELSGKDKAQITVATPLSTLLQGSLGLLRLEAALRHRLGVANAGVKQAATFGDLCRILEIDSGSVSAPETPPTQVAAQAPAIEANATASANGIHVGIDAELIRALPEATDYWEHEFYKNTFSPREIAYALLQPAPRETFAAAWCAKEALRKARPALMQEEWTALEVVHDASGKPAMTVRGKTAGGALSISHAGELAVAVFVAPEPVQSTPFKSEPQNYPVPPLSARKASRGSIALALLAFLISLVALFFSAFHR